MKKNHRIEAIIENSLFASRWLLAPFYIGLALALVLLLHTFVMEIFHFFGMLPDITTSDTILAVLSLIDLSLAGNLVIIVIFSGYENFISKFDVDDHEDRPEWQGKVDFSGLKLKLIASIVAISSIHLLKIFMDIKQYDHDDVMWMLIIHGVFVTSGLMLAAMDYIAGQAKPH